MALKGVSSFEIKLYDTAENVEEKPIPVIIQSKPIIQKVVQKAELSSTQSYISPLRIFRSYRFSPYFRRQNFDVSSRTVSHKLDANVPLCTFSMMGKCNDDRHGFIN